MRRQVSYFYTLLADNATYTLPSGNPTVSNPAPTNNDPVELSLSGLQADRKYTILISARSQAGLSSATATSVSWQFLASAPSVAVRLRPDLVSGASRPAFQFVADWGTSQVGGQANVTFQMLLLGDPDLGTYHTPPVCDPTRANSASQKDCVSPGCTSELCNYTTQLTLAPGKSQAYTLQVRPAAWRLCVFCAA